MPAKKRNSKRRAALDDDEIAWLIGDQINSRFMIFMPLGQLEELWDQHGDPNIATWDRRDFSHPKAITA